MNRTAVRRRGAATVVAVVAVLVLFLVRLVDVQLVNAQSINEEAEGRRGVTSTIWGDRGDILDASGTVLAGSVDRFDITVSPRNVADITEITSDGEEVVVMTRDDALAKLASITGQDPTQVTSIVDDALAADPESNYALLTRSVTLEQYEAVRALAIPWLYYERHPARVYPNGAVAGNLTGFLGSDSTPLAGLENSLDSCLAGVDGELMYERGADGVQIPGSEVTITEMQQGGDLMLSIDLDTQWYAQQVIASEVQRMGGQYGHITVQEVKTGKLVAVAEWPSVDPNNPGLSEPDDRGSRAFTSPYEPGSTIKPLTAAGVLDAGLTTPDEHFVVPDSWDQDGASFSDDSNHPVANWTAAGIMAVSSNVGIAMMGQRLSADARYDNLVNFGLGSPTETGFLGEESGTVHPASEWDPQTNYATMFGQGLEVTAPQMASIYQTIANGGVRLPVSLAQGCRAADGTVAPLTSGEPRQVISPEAAAQTLTLLEATAQSGHNAAETSIPGYRVGVKTGTAQISSGEGTYLDGQYMTSMAGVAPIDDPRYVVVVSIMDPTTTRSSAATAPAWKDVMSYVLEKNRVPTSPQPWPTIQTSY
ncbi:cell division protein FtsI (penicillin-binding protein 3) [Pseudoclavibacter chungangensis]|uniref:peptidoglycan D,D-transpeptidase FtsI family protein n=1 Tax=Pseudoclavibacter chungangensis TaxID=587635 RepID=UPI0015C7F334|nr:penicillin-binding protein 2 [Pseudoclavibacter chungangensis]NYJ66793.1 cell division protein FtsI (penicillin-binding protein 3) [Pseudoclavibacter chungangensis]